MKETMRKPWFRGIVTLGLVGVLGAGVMMSPVTAAITKPKVKKIATRVANKAITNYVNTNEGAFVTAVNGPVTLSTTLSPVASLSLPAGKYALFAKARANQLSSNPDVICELVVAGTTRDAAQTELDAANPNRAMLSLLAGASLTGPGTAELRCRHDSAGTGNVQDVKLLAIRTPTLTG